MSDPRSRAIIGQRSAAPADPQHARSLWVADDPVVTPAPVTDARPAVPAPTGHRVPSTVDFDELMQRNGLSPLFMAEHVAYRKDRRRAR